MALSYEGECAYTQTHSPEPMTHFMTFPVLAPVIAAWEESTIALADLKEIQTSTMTVTGQKESMTNFMDV